MKFYHSVVMYQLILVNDKRFND